MGQDTTIIHSRQALFNPQRPMLSLKIGRARYQLCDFAGRSDLSGLWSPLVVESKLLLKYLRLCSERLVRNLPRAPPRTMERGLTVWW